MVENKGKKGKKLGRPIKHGGYSIVNRDRLVGEHPEVARYLREAREKLIEHVAGEESRLSQQQKILIDRIISKLSVIRLFECYIASRGVFRDDGTPEPAIEFWLKVNNSLRMDLVSLGIQKKEIEAVIDLKAYLEMKAGEKSQGVKNGEASESGRSEIAGCEASGEKTGEKNGAI